MGLATPAAMAVGFGTRRRKVSSSAMHQAWNRSRHIKQVVFDKTGTLTTGKFNIGAFETTTDDPLSNASPFPWKNFSNHPVAMAISREWKINDPIHWVHVQEIKGLGIEAKRQGREYLQSGIP